MDNTAGLTRLLLVATMCLELLNCLAICQIRRGGPRVISEVGMCRADSVMALLYSYQPTMAISTPTPPHSEVTIQKQLM